ncbi:hypothetical protein RQP46_002149 [Phenoliferia psychrophenolica]
MSPRTRRQTDPDPTSESTPPTSPDPSALASLPLELLSHIVRLALDPQPDTTHSPSNSLLLRTLALVSRPFHHAAIRLLVVSPRLASPSHLRVFLSLISRLGIGGCVKELCFDGGELPVRELNGVVELELTAAERTEREQERRDRFYNAMDLKVVRESGYHDQLARVAELCHQVVTLRLRGQVQPEVIITNLAALPIQVVWLDNSCVTGDMSLPSSTHTLHLYAVQMATPSLLSSISLPLPTLRHLSCRPITFSKSNPPRETPNGTLLDTLPSLLLESDYLTLRILEGEHLPELTHLELVEKESATAMSLLAELERQVGPRLAVLERNFGLSKTFRLPKLKVLTLPDDEMWRVSWEKVKAEMGVREEVTVVWRAK